MPEFFKYLPHQDVVEVLPMITGFRSARYQSEFGQSLKFPTFTPLLLSFSHDCQEPQRSQMAAAICDPRLLQIEKVSNVTL